MKNTNLTFTILIFFITLSLSFAQSTINDTIYLKNGSKIIKDFFGISIGKKKISLIELKESSRQKKKIRNKDFKKSELSISEIDKIINNSLIFILREQLTQDDKVWNHPMNSYKRYVYIHKRIVSKNVVKPNGKEQLLDLLVEGNCDLYYDRSLVVGNPATNNLKTLDHYYVKRKGMKESIHFQGKGYVLGSNQKSKYFDDCPAVSEFISKHKRLSHSEIIEAVMLYNEKCF